MDYEKQKNRVREYFDRWASHLGLDWWDIGLLWGYNGADFDHGEGPQGIAYVRAQWEHRMASIHFNMHLLERRTDQELEMDVLHELVHIPLFEMEREAEKQDFQKHRERVVVSLSQAFLWVRQAGFEEGIRHERRRRKKKKREHKTKEVK